MLEVQQGYTKCSICVVSENAIITSDIGIHCKAKESGIDSLLISPGYIDLPGYKYGFIGGASFKISDNVIAFTGSLDSHPDKDNIEHFLCKYDEKVKKPEQIMSDRLFGLISTELLYIM